MLIHGQGMGFKQVYGTWAVNMFSYDAMKQPAGSTARVKRTMKNDRWGPMPFNGRDIPVLNASIGGTSTVTGAANLRRNFIGAITTVSTMAGVLFVPIPFIGRITATSTVDGVLKMNLKMKSPRIKN